MKRKNPVRTHDSIDALDLLTQILPILRGKKQATPALIAAVAEQRMRHLRALQRVIGDEPVKGE